MKIEPIPQKQLLKEIEIGLLWLSKYQSRSNERHADFMVKYNSFMVRLIGATETYLGWYDKDEFWDWLALLPVNDDLKDRFYTFLMADKDKKSHTHKLT